jgi:hypothetical protein
VKRQRCPAREGTKRATICAYARCLPASESVPAAAGGRPVAGRSPSPRCSAPSLVQRHSPAIAVDSHLGNGSTADLRDRWQVNSPARLDQAASRTAAARYPVSEHSQTRWASQARAPYPTSRSPAPAPSLPQPRRLYPPTEKDITVLRRSAKSFVPLHTLAPPYPYLSGRITRARNRVKPDHTEDSIAGLPPIGPVFRCRGSQHVPPAGTRHGRPWQCRIPQARAQAPVFDPAGSRRPSRCPERSKGTYAPPGRGPG